MKNLLTALVFSVALILVGCEDPGQEIFDDLNTVAEVGDFDSVAEVGDFDSVAEVGDFDSVAEVGDFDSVAEAADIGDPI